MDEVERIAHERRPEADPRRLVAPTRASWTSSASARSPTRSARYLMVDMAHFAGLVAAGVHPNPVPYADVVTTTVHKTLGGARGGMILCREEHAKAINSAVFPGQQGGPLEHVIAGKAVALQHRRRPRLFRERQQRTVAGAKARGRGAARAPAHGVNVLTGGTDVHLVLVDLRESELDGQQAEDRLHEIGITVNRNAVPFDPRPPMVTSGLRVGTQRARHPRPAGRRLPRGRADHRHRADGRTSRPARPSWPSASRRSPTATRSTSTWHARRRGVAQPPRAVGSSVDDRGRRGLAFLAAFVVAALLTPLTARLARRVGAVDQPTERGLGAGSTPLLGGLAILGGVLVELGPVPRLRRRDVGPAEGHPRRRGRHRARRRARRPLRPAAGRQARRPDRRGDHPRRRGRRGHQHHAALRRRGRASATRAGR